MEFSPTAKASARTVASPAPAPVARSPRVIYADLIANAVRYEAASVKWRAAEAQMPWWARSGPSYLTHDGRIVGDRCGWPAIVDADPPEAGIRRHIRPSEDDLRRWAEIATRSDPRSAAAIDAQLQRRLDALAMRRAAQKAERDRVGLDALSEELDESSDRMWRLEEEIAEMPVGGDPEALVLVLLLAVRKGDVHDARFYAPGDGGPDEPTLSIRAVLSAFGALLPTLPQGQIRADVEEMLSGKPFAECAFMAGEHAQWPEDR